MHQDSSAGDVPGARNRYLDYIAAALITYGAVGVAVSLRLLDLLLQGLSSWFRAPAAWDAPLSTGVLGPLQAHFDALAWLPWAAWLVGVALLGLRRTRPAPGEVNSTHGRLPGWLASGAALIVLVLVGGYLRMSQLWPQEYGITRWPYDDEGVYAGAAQLFLQGIMPYRDYFFAHPPLAAISYAPAMAYHFTEWGSPTSFMMARYLSVFYSLVTLALLFFVGRRLGGLWAGVIAGGLWAVDGRVIEINRKVMLEGPLVMLSCAAVLFYLWARPSLAGEAENRPGRGATAAYLALAGAASALSALTKIAGLACLLAIVIDLLWLALDRRGRVDAARPTTSLWSQLGWLALGAVAAGAVALGPFLLAAPSQLVREVLFFQFLRPSDGVIDAPARIGDVTSTLGNALTPLIAALGVFVLSVWAWQRRDASAWRTVVLWMLFSVILFTYSRSFYQHYYIQLAAPLALLGAAVALTPQVLERSAIFRRAGGRSALWVGLAPAALLALVSLPLLYVQWTGTTTRDCPHCVDPLFQVVGRYANDAVSPGTTVLSTDEQFNLQAARPPSHNDTGYLIDSYGHMIYLGLGLGERGWGDLVSSVLRGAQGIDPYAVMHLPAPQADFLDRASRAGLVVVHDRGNARLTPETLQALEKVAAPEIAEPRYTIYRAR